MRNQDEGYRPKSHIFLATSLLLTLGACAPLSTPTSPELGFAVPAAWSSADAASQSQSLTLAVWWQRFDDPLLSALIHQALVANTGVTGAQAALNQSRALQDVASAALWPRLDSSFSARRGRDNDVSSNHFQVGLDASWEIDVFGANRSAVNAAEATARASGASLAQVQVSVVAEVALNYIALRSTQERLAIATANLATQQETWQLTDWRWQAGLVTSLETEQARAAVEQTAAQIPALQTTLEQTRHALAVLTGQPPAALLAVLAPTGALPQAPAGLAVSFPAETLRQRPDVQVAQWQVIAAAARTSQAEAALLPSFKLGGSLGLSALTLGALTNGSSVAAAVLASLSWPVVDGGASRAQWRAQQAVLAQATTRYQATVLTALTEVEDALVALRGDQERLRRLSNAALAADTAATLASQRFNSGLVDFQTVLETQRSRLATQDGVASARALVSADHVRLYKALGGGWQPDGASTLPAAYTTSNRTPLP